MSLEHKGYVALFAEPLKKDLIKEIVALWLSRYGGVEQASGNSYQIVTNAIHDEREIIWEKNLQFRVLCGEQFAWIYITLDRFVIETSGLFIQEGALLCHDVLTELPACEEIIDERNDSRLDELERFGLM